MILAVLVAQLAIGAGLVSNPAKLGNRITDTLFSSPVFSAGITDNAQAARADFLADKLFIAAIPIAIILIAYVAYAIIYFTKTMTSSK